MPELEPVGGDNAFYFIEVADPEDAVQGRDGEAEANADATVCAITRCS
jgi:hypothetical protein